MPIDPSVIDNPRSGRLRKALDLADSRFRRRFGRFLVEGPQSVREALSWDSDAMRDVFVADDLMDDPDTDGGPVGGSSRVSILVDRAVELGIHVHPVDSGLMGRVASEAQGIFSVCDIPTDASMNPQVGADIPGRSLVSAFWQIRDPGNAGAVIRVADAAGCSVVVFVDDCVDPYSPKVVRSSAGSLFHIPVLRMGTEKFLEWSRTRPVPMVAADVHGTDGRPARMLPDVVDEGAVASGGSVIFGNEARGLPDDILDRVDTVVSIPMYGRAESMNLATSAAVMLFTMAMSGRGMSSHVGTIERR
ncbi:RNA methyltransferase [uncultured Bifidobacterium sp.]|uniref:TrmH family RNA methyltransferase n=1 Tax=uncultured Bifidobacterium sp. TaxID=165187 RepID=UPI002605A3A5|nr:RNA methyltransferase [uncultured Bifidobacterium sp.]